MLLFCLSQLKQGIGSHCPIAATGSAARHLFKKVYSIPCFDNVLSVVYRICLLRMVVAEKSVKVEREKRFGSSEDHHRSYLNFITHFCQEKMLVLLGVPQLRNMYGAISCVRLPW